MKAKHDWIFFMPISTQQLDSFIHWEQAPTQDSVAAALANDTFPVCSRAEASEAPP